MQVRKVVATLWALAWIASLFLPTVTRADFPQGEWHFGHEILATGWMGFLAGQFGWLANLLLPLALSLTLFSKTPRVFGVLVSVLLLAVAVNAMFWNSWHEMGVGTFSLYFGPGYYLWFLAVLGGGVTLLIRALLDEKPPSRN